MVGRTGLSSLSWRLSPGEVPNPTILTGNDSWESFHAGVGGGDGGAAGEGGGAGDDVDDGGGAMIIIDGATSAAALSHRPPPRQVVIGFLSAGLERLQLPSGFVGVCPQTFLVAFLRRG